jgi:2-C-methyl-D-erythritol 2,4-cyclodiphosphate synthase/2-C-methyl-D-erythritol 4-phosphate cytidylyltransferase
MVAGQTVLERTLSVFQAHPAIASLVIVAGEAELERVRAAAATFSKVVAVVIGGETRADSVRRGLDALPPNTELVLVHDAARPLLSPQLIDRILAATAQVGAAVPGLPLSDTIKRVDRAGQARATIPRSATVQGELLSGLTAVQTPQGARLALLRAAYARFDFAQNEATDEASLLEAIGAPVAVVPGDPANIKITRPEDVALAETLLQRSLVSDQPIQNPQPMEPHAQHLTTNADIRAGLGYDVHAFAEPAAGRKLFLGGVAIPHDRGLEGHSDADVLLHAVCDALLGAASLGDIGMLFPNTDPAYKDISSLRLLESVGERLAAAGWQVANIDATVVAEAPKLMPHRAAIQQAIAGCLNLEPDRISVKATTSEKLGFIGRKEGVAAWAVATIQREPNRR